MHSATLRQSGDEPPTPPMRILIFGPTGGTGRELVTQALELGHEVTAFARNPAAITATHHRLHVIQGDISYPEMIAPAIQGHEAVLSALGVRALKVGTILSDACRQIVRTMEQLGVRRLVWQSSLGVALTRGQLGPIYNWILIPLLFREIFTDKERQEQIIRESELDWTIVEPAALTNGPRTDGYRSGPGAAAGRFLPRISRADVAHFMLAQLTAPEFIRRSAPLAY